MILKNILPFAYILFFNAYSSQDFYYLSAIKILSEKYNSFNSYIYIDEIYDSRLLELYLKDSSSTITILTPSHITESFKMPKVPMIVVFYAFANSSLNSHTIFLSNVQISVIISEAPFESIPKNLVRDTNSVILKNGQIWGVNNCKSNSFFRHELKDLKNIDLLNMRNCKYFGSTHLNSFDFPLIVKINKTQATGKFQYFNFEFVYFLNKKISIYSETENITNIELVTSFTSSLLGISNIENIEFCLMVPKIRLLEEELYISYIFSNNIWIIIFLSFFYIAIVIKYSFKISFFKGFQQIIGLVTWTSLSPFKISRFFQIIIFSLIIFYGFWLNNIYLANLSTFLTSYVYGKQIQTEKDFLESGLNILGSSYDSTKFRKELQETFIVETDYGEIMNHIFNFNTTFAYLVLNHNWEHIEKSQELLQKKKFQYTKLCDSDSKSYFLVSMLPPKHVIPFFLKYSLMVNEAGLMDIWKTLAYLEMQKFGVFKYLKDSEEVRKPLTFLFYKKIFIVLFGGWIFGGLAFGFEKLFAKRKLNKCQCCF